MQWFNLTAASSKEVLPDLEGWFWNNGAVSVTVEDAQNEPIFEPGPGEIPVWDEVLVTGLFEGDVSMDEMSQLLGECGYNMVGLESLHDRPWERVWLDRFKPMRFGQRVWICPTGHELDEAGKVVVHLDPGLAFGTGTHETTRLCLEFLDSVDLQGKIVIDYGCGSGILGIAAGLLGAACVYGIDNDVQAITATNENAARNKVEIITGLPFTLDCRSADLIVANILAQPLVELCEGLIAMTKPGGQLILSGIMTSQSEWVESAYGDQLSLVDRHELNGWMRLVWRK